MDATAERAADPDRGGALAIWHEEDFTNFRLATYGARIGNNATEPVRLRELQAALERWQAARTGGR